MAITDLTAWHAADGDMLRRHQALVDLFRDQGGQGALGWVDILNPVETDALVQALADPQVAEQRAAIALELLQAGRRHPAFYHPVLRHALAQGAHSAAFALVVDACLHQQLLSDDLLGQVWQRLAEPAVPGAICWQVIEAALAAGVVVPITLLGSLRQRRPSDLPTPLWVYLFGCLCDFDPNKAEPVEQAMVAAVQAFADGQLDQAVSGVTALLRQGLDFSGATDLLIYFCRAAGQPARAVAALHQILAEQPNNLSCLLALADEYYDADDLVASADYLWSALQVMATDRTGRDFSAIRSVVRLQCAHRRSVQHRCAEHLEQAVMCYRAALADGVTDLALWHNLGMALAELGRDDEAFEALKQAKGFALISFWPKMTPWPELPVPAGG